MAKLGFRGTYDTDTGNLVTYLDEDWFIDHPGLNFYQWVINGMSYMRFGRGGQRPPKGAQGITEGGKE